jgi:two-component system OmpR family response regulator
MTVVAALPPQALRIVIVEDNDELCAILVAGLRHFKHEVRGVGDGRALDAALREAPADVVILDIGLPGEDGIEIARRLRQGCNCGIVMLTARGRVDDRVLSYGIGADLYFVKPVDMRELDAALRSLGRRMFGTPPSAWRFNSRTSRLFTPGDREIPLTALECIVIRKLMETPGDNVSRKDIFAALDQPDDQYADKRLEALISRLRSKVRRSDPGFELPVCARHNIGYAFLAEVGQ